MNPVKLNIVDGHDLLLNKGDAIIIKGHENKTQLIMVCPNCGKTSSSRGGHVYNRETKSYHPSIIHDIKYGGCGWHGWLINGEFEDC